LIIREEANRIMAEDDAVEMARWLSQATINVMLGLPNPIVTFEEFSRLAA
jgi:hypothetical protein